MERVYSGERYMGKERKLEECRGINRRIQTRRNRSETTGENREEEVDEYRRMKLPGKYTAKLLYGWDDKKFEDEYLKKL